uniref:Uncharacterized protein n=1 Tax=Octopus bimaculoides TaxID=37653 RepID=A0A0L8HXP3_OCTBM
MNMKLFLADLMSPKMIKVNSILSGQVWFYMQLIMQLKR